MSTSRKTFTEIKQKKRNCYNVYDNNKILVELEDGTSTPSIDEDAFATIYLGQP